MIELVHLDQLAHALLDYLLYPFITLLMCLLSVFVVLGNLLVVTAIWHENQLHSVTNYLIASLAAADCLVGALVMPFSIISEMIIGSWTFGPVLCDLWHSFDVLASTASIMNLCAISLDRYLAITNPICYPTKMTPKRVALLIVSLWTCSSLISFPAILWWHAVGDGPLQQVGPERWLAASSLPSSLSADTSSSGSISSSMIDEGQLTISAQEKLNARLEATEWRPPERQPDRRLPQSASSSLQDNNNNNYNNNLNRSPPDEHHQETRPPRPPPPPPPPDVRYKCPFTDDTYYLLFSSFVSFYGPLCVMLYAYICIYRAAVQQTRFLKYGSKQVSIGHAGNCYSETSGMGDAAGGPAGKAGGGRHNKKSKRLRQTSERSQAANCDNYEQHLVLRAHRGGGANNLVKLDSAASKRAKSQHKHKQQLQQASPTDEDGDDEDEDESEATGGTGRRDRQMAQSSLDRTSTLSESLLEGGHLRPASLERVSQAEHQVVAKPTSANSAGRPIRANLMMSQRDKLRVESQRFDPPSNSSSVATITRPGAAVELDRTTRRLTKKASDDGSELMPTREAQLESAAASRKLLTTSGSTSSSGSSGCDGTQSAASQRQANAASSSLPPVAHVGRQTDVSHHFRLMKALRASSQVPPQLPASLVPLIMMNSDTSTDSSIVTVVTRPIGDTNLSETTAADEIARAGSVESKRLDVASGACAKQTGGEESGGAKATHQVTINLGFHEGENSASESAGPAKRSTTSQAKAVNGKGQILHYNSDKLIQSIVDLDNIHYIDCGAQGRVADSPNEGVACASGAAPQDGTLHDQKAGRKSLGEQPVARAAAANQVSEPENSRLLTRGATTRVVAHSKQVVEVVGGRQQRSVGKKLSKLAKERKAAKTLGIVVGVFILCWLPFFVVNILVALCGLKCIYKPDLLFSIVTWLGWLNSAMNPVIYACWSRDFRRAFRRVLCTWVEFLCWDGTRLARKLKLKKAPHYSSGTTQRSGTSVEINVGAVGSQSSGGHSKAAVLRTNSNSNSSSSNNNNNNNSSKNKNNNNNSRKLLLAD